MGNFVFHDTGISGLILVEAKKFGDHRGYFMETFQEQAFRDAGIDKPFVQDNQSCSSKGVLRGLHFQKKHPQGKLVRVLSGAVYDVAVDLRKSSPTFGQWRGYVLSEENRQQLYVPEGFAHGFLVLSDSAVFAYKCTDFYHPEDEGGLYFADKTIAIDWEKYYDGELLISDKDRQQPTFSALDFYFE